MHGPNATKAARNVAMNMVNLGASQQAAFDPTTILVIIDIIKEVFAMCDNFRNPTELKSAADNPSWLTRWFLRRRVINNVGRRGWREYGREMVDAMLKTGSDASLAEFQALYQEMKMN